MVEIARKSSTAIASIYLKSLKIVFPNSIKVYLLYKKTILFQII